MMPRTGPRRDLVKKQGMVWLAGAGMWIAIGAAVILPPDRAGWVRVTAACCYGLAALSFTAVYAARRRRSRRTGSGLSVRGRDDDDGPDGGAVHRWRTLAVVSRLMPRSAGRRWLAEAESLLAEVTDARRRAAVRSYLLSAPRLAMMMWARVVLRWARPGPRRPG
jgi:hypothetical protein